MPILSRLWNYLLTRKQQRSLPRSSPLPTPPPRSRPRPPLQTIDWVSQPWHEFKYNPISHGWAALKSQDSSSITERTINQTARSSEKQRLTLLTWNVDAARPRPRARIAAMLSYILTLSPPVDIIFLQEVSRLALEVIRDDPRIRSCWFSTDADDTYWGRQLFGTMALLSKASFHHDHPLPSTLESNSSCRMVLGRIWRIKYHSRYNRDALCCDVHVVPPASHTAARRRRALASASSTCISTRWRHNLHTDLDRSPLWPRLFEMPAAA